ncbi:MAG: lysophospholipid acyltransferase family protein [Myxococcales bacterium]
MRFCRLVDFVPGDIEARLPAGPFVLVANHPTLIDVVLLLASYPSICCVASSRYFSSPLVGTLLRSCGHIDAGEGNAFDGLAVIDGALERLRAGDPVLIFPEGTRSPWPGIGPFRAGAFVIASLARVPVVPVTIRPEPPGLLKGMSWYTVPDGTICYEMCVLPALDPPPSNQEAKLSANATRALIEARVFA